LSGSSTTKSCRQHHTMSTCQHSHDMMQANMQYAHPQEAWSVPSGWYAKLLAANLLVELPCKTVHHHHMVALRQLVHCP
jgi:hypothetical protein